MMRPEDLAELAAAMTAAGLARLELTGPDFRLVLSRGGAADPPAAGDPPSPAEAEADTDAADTDAEVVAVTAPGIGSFLRTHPLHDRPLAEDGETVAAGQTIALLRIGALLTPVPAPAGGLIVAAVPEEGALVGYGDPLFDFLPQE